MRIYNYWSPTFRTQAIVTVIILLIFSSCRLKNGKALDSIEKQYQEYYKTNEKELKELVACIQSMDPNCDSPGPISAQLLNNYYPNNSNRLNNLLEIKLKRPTVSWCYSNYRGIQFFPKIDDPKCYKYSIWYYEGEVIYSQDIFFLDKEKKWSIGEIKESPCF